MNFVIGLVAVAFIMGGVLDYLSLPIAGINQAGVCKYLIVEGEKRPCDRLPSRYVKEYVAGW